MVHCGIKYVVNVYWEDLKKSFLSDCRYSICLVLSIIRVTIVQYDLSPSKHLSLVQNIDSQWYQACLNDQNTLQSIVPL